MPPTQVLLLLVTGWLAAFNLAAFTAFGWDKQRARAGDWRVSESDLLTLAFLGGTPATYAARALFRHKTRKQPFSNRLHLIASGQAVAVAAAVGWWLGG